MSVAGQINARHAKWKTVQPLDSRPNGTRRRPAAPASDGRPKRLWDPQPWENNMKTSDIDIPHQPAKRRAIKVSAAILTGMLWLGTQPALQAQPNFTRITTGPLVTDLGNSFLANIGDYDGDGYLDVFVARWNIGRASLYHNNGNGTFSSVTNALFPLAPQYNGFGAIWADLDNDGRLDLAGLDYYSTHPSFFAFNNGDGSFTKVEFGSQSAWNMNMVDFDRDGLLDLYLVGGLSLPVLTNHVYRNLDGRSFVAVPRSDMGDLLKRAPAWDWASWADYDDDGSLDVFAASVTNYTRCQMYRNDGSGRFVSVTNQVTLDAINSLSAAWGDYDNDGRVDLCVCAFAWSDFSGWTSFIYRNLGSGQFERASIGLNLGAGSIAAWGDYDNDGFLDLLITKARDRGCSLFRNNGNSTFTRMTNGPIVTNAPLNTWCFTAAWFDYDNDGFLDAFVANGADSAPAAVGNYLYHNEGNANAWLKVKLVGTVSNRDAVGAKVRAKATFAGATRWQRRDIAVGDLWSGNNNPIAHFGLADATNVETLRVEWPSGQVTELHNVAVRQSLTITEAPGLRATVLAQGTMQLQLTAHTGMNVGMEVSSNVVDWVSWQTVPQTNRITPVTDPEAGQHPRRFYKARVQ